MKMIPGSFISDGIKHRLAKAVDKRDPSHITMSSLGHCARQLGYRYHGIEGTPLPWRTMMVFSDGDMAHNQLRAMIVESLKDSRSCWELVEQEKSVNYQGIIGHVDGVLAHKDQECHNTNHKPMLLEVKSMNDRGFKELAKTQEIGFEYRCQVSGYLAGLGLETAVILVKNKNNGELQEFIYHREDDLLSHRMGVIEAITLSQGPEDLIKEYQPNSRGNLPWQCGYCPFVQLCWRDYEVVQVKPNVWKVNVKLINKEEHHGSTQQIVSDTVSEAEVPSV